LTKKSITSPEILNTKVVANALNFPLVTHTIYSNAQFDSYGILKSGHGAENFLDIPMNDQVLKAEYP
jgi:hypothetical protein